jgi:phosphatidylserine/phosphatidylglycerophosphate/cardiolipin synthase-like enzyme
VLLGLWLATGLYHGAKPLPAGLDHEGDYAPAGEVAFLRDVTWQDAAGRRQVDQQIFDRVLELVAQADQLLVLDQFLFNDYLGSATNALRPLSSELAEAIVRRRQERPGLKCWFITDPINTVYGGQESALVERLRRAGVVVVPTRLPRLRDSNPLYSALWRLGLRVWPRRWGPMLPNPLGRGRVPLASVFELLNFKANHRKTVIADRRGELVALVSSANPHDGSSAHHNVALEFTGPAVRDLLATEAAVCALSGQPVPEPPPAPEAGIAAVDALQVRILTENAIERAVLDLIRGAQSGEELDLAMFYLSSRPVVRALAGAHRRGVRLRVLLDPNKDAFGREKNGVPNRPVAAELVRAGVPVRWAATHGEQFHSKMIRHRSAANRETAILGSANYTRRNLGNYNLETCAQLRGPAEAPVFRDMQETMDLVWDNADGRIFSTDYSEYADTTFLHALLYRIQEATGLSTF